MTGSRTSVRYLAMKTAAVTAFLLLSTLSFVALGTDTATKASGDDGGETLVIFEGATMEGFRSIVGMIESEGGFAYSSNPPNAIQASLPPGLGSELLSMPGVHSVHTGPVDVDAMAGLGQDVVLACTAWNIHLEKISQGDTEFLMGADTDDHGDHLHHDGIAQTLGDAIACYEDLSCTNDTEKVQAFAEARRSGVPPSGLGMLGPGPGTWELSEYLLGSVGVAIVLPESNGSVDTNQENWDSTEEANVISEINQAFSWWSNQKNSTGLTTSLTFSYKSYLKQPTSYEPITRRGFTGASTVNMWTWMNEILQDLGYTTGMNGLAAFANATRNELGTDWGYIIWVADSTVDGDNQFADGTFGFASLGGPEVVMTYENDGYGIGSMDSVTSHETGHIFYALDEYPGSSSSGARCGYENVLNGNSQVVGTPPPITNVGCVMRGGGATTPCSFTKGMIGWNDTDGDKIPNVLDTFPNTTLDPLPGGALNGSSYTFYGNASETPLNNRNPAGSGNDVTLNKVSLVEWKLDSGSWTQATAIDGAWGNYTEAFNFSVTGLTDGNHSVYSRAKNSINQWEVQPYNLTFSVDRTPPTTALLPLPVFVTTDVIRLNWTWDDGTGSGLKHAELYSRKGGGSWQKFPTNQVLSPIMFTHDGDGFYEFYTVGVDDAGNREAPKTAPYVNTTVETQPPSSEAGPLPNYVNTTSFDVPYKATDAGIGVEFVEMFYRKDGDIWNGLGKVGPSPVRFTSSGDGKYEFYTVATDFSGNLETKLPKVEAWTVLDTSVPFTDLKLNGLAGENGWYLSKVTVSMSSSERPESSNGTFYRLDGGLWTEYTSNFDIDGDGITNLEYHSLDKAGNNEDVKGVVLKIDTTIPTGTITINGGAEATNDANVAVQVTAQDDAAPVLYMIVSEDGSFSSSGWQDLAASINLTLTPRSGIKTVYAMFKNDAGLETEPVSAIIELDSDPPDIEITGPMASDIVPKLEFQVEGTATDNSAVARVEVSVDGGKWVLANGTDKWSVTVSVPKDGFHNISARAFDALNNSATAQVTVEVDATPPELKLDTPSDGSTTSKKTIPVSGRTDPRGILRVNGEIVHVDPDGSFNTSVTLKEGENTIIIKVEKPAGKVETKVKVTYVKLEPITISDLKHSPVAPKPGGEVTVSCAAPGTHISGVEVKWKVGAGGTEHSKAMTKGSDGRWEATIGSFKNGDKVDYYVKATDTGGSEARYPAITTKSFTVSDKDIDDDEDAGMTTSSDTSMLGLGILALLLIAGVALAVAVLIMVTRRREPIEPGDRPAREGERLQRYDISSDDPESWPKYDEPDDEWAIETEDIEETEE